MLWLNRLLNLVATVGGLLGGGALAGVVPVKVALVGGFAGTLAAKYAKTPSQAMAAAAPAPKDP